MWLNSMVGLFFGMMVDATVVGARAVMAPLLVILMAWRRVGDVGTDLLYAALTKMVGFNHAGGRVDGHVPRRLVTGSLPAAMVTLAWPYWPEARGIRAASGTVMCEDAITFQGHADTRPGNRIALAEQTRKTLRREAGRASPQEDPRTRIAIRCA